MCSSLAVVAGGTHIGTTMQSASEISSDGMQRMAQAVLTSLPAQFRDQLGDVVLRVAEFATAEQLAAVGLVEKWHLSGLYEGQPVPDQSVWESGRMPPRIWLFRQPLLAEWRETGVRMDDLVRHVVIHEAGHHFGFSDDDMHWLEDKAD